MRIQIDEPSLQACGFVELGALIHVSRHPYCLFLMGELFASLHANAPDSFIGLLSKGIQKLGMTEVEELLLDWLYSFLTGEEQDRLLGWHLAVSLNSDARECDLSPILPFSG